MPTTSDYYPEFSAKLRGGHRAVAYFNLSTKAVKLKGPGFPKANLPTYRTNGHGVQETHTKTPATVTVLAFGMTVYTY